MPMKRSLNNCLWLTLLGILSFGSAINTAAQANPTPSPDSRSASRPATNTPLIMFEPPTDEKVDNSRGGASRPTDVKCMHDESYGFPMTALVPQSGVGLTTSSHPTLMVYVPPTMATQAI